MKFSRCIRDEFVLAAGAFICTALARGQGCHGRETSSRAAKT